MTLYRDATLADRKFVIATWASSYKNSHYSGLITSEDWPTIAHEQIGKILDRPNTRAIVAYDPPSFLYGFIAGDPTGVMPIVHYVYVKDPYRSEAAPGGERTGPRHARGLFAALGIDPTRTFLYTCRTSACVQLAHKIPLARFTPGAARYENYLEHRSRTHGR